MKLYTYITLIICLFAVYNSYSQATLKFNQTFASQDAIKINMDVDSDNIQIKTIKGSRIVVETLIKISSSNTRLLEFIADGGRYNLDKSFDSRKSELNLISKKNKDIIRIKGETITEEFVYVIYVPETTAFVNEAVASR
jgi:hypothetical protein